MGTAKLVWADEVCGGVEGAVPTGSWSMSMELWSLMAELDSSESRFLSSGGKLRGCVSGSTLLLREEEPGSVECLEPRDGREDDLVSMREDGREDFLGEDLGEDFWGDGGSDRKR